MAGENEVLKEKLPQCRFDHYLFMLSLPSYIFLNLQVCTEIHLKRQDGMMWTGSIWLIIETSGGLL
jgi:hypothetical protein